jgi:tetratricopeptide (TPR) repeat protein
MGAFMPPLYHFSPPLHNRPLEPALGIPILEDTDQDQLIRAVKRWLSEHSNWLLVLDNVEDFELVLNLLPVVRRGHVLLITRAQDTGGTAKSIEIDRMLADEGALLLLRRAGLLTSDDLLDLASSADIEQALKISAVLDGLPLALVQAGAYIQATGCGMAGYLSRYEKQRAKLLHWRDRLNTDYPESVATTWSLSFERVQQVSSTAADLMRLCAFFFAEAIPEEMIIEGSHNLGQFLQEVTDEIQLDECFRILRRYSFVQRNLRDKTFSIHRLVQAVQLDNMERETQYLWANRALYAVNQALPYVEAGTQQGQRFFLHAQACCSFIKEQHLASLEAAQLLHKTGRYLREASQYAQAESFCQEALQLYEALSDAPQIELVHCCSDLALVSERLGKFVEAEVLYGRAWVICERLYGMEHPETAVTLNNLGLFYLNQGRITQAEQHIKQALEIRTKILGPDNLQVANSRNCLAELYSDRGMVAEAEQLHKQVLELRERILGPEHPSVGNALNNLAKSYLQQGRLDDAEPICQRAIAIYERNFGSEHHVLAYPLANLAAIYEHQGKSSEAEALFKRSLSLREQALGEDHPEVAVALVRLAVLYKKTGRLSVAEALCQRALLILEKTSSGPELPQRINALSTLTLIYLDQEKYEEAEQLTKRLLTLAKQLYGPEHLRVIKDLNVIGICYLDRHEYARARSLYERMLDVSSKVLGSDHPAIVKLKINVARACEFQGDYFTADLRYMDTLQEIRQKWGLERHPDAPKLLEWYSAFLKKQKRLDEAAHVDAILQRLKAISKKGTKE